MKIVKKLPNGKSIIKVEQKVKNKVITKYTIAEGENIVNILDTKGDISGIQYFDTYEITKDGDIIIGILKNGIDYYNRVVKHYDLSPTLYDIREIQDLNDSRIYLKCSSPARKIEEIVPKGLEYSYGVINREGVLSIYPSYDKITEGTENTCVVGMLKNTNFLYGYNDVLDGSEITPVCFQSNRDFHDGLALVKYNCRYGYIDRNRVMTNPKEYSEYSLFPQFYMAGDFNNGVATVFVTKSGCRKINRKGEILPRTEEEKTYKMADIK